MTLYREVPTRRERLAPRARTAIALSVAALSVAASLAWQALVILQLP